MGSHLGNPVEAWKWQQGGGRNCTVMGESERSRPCRMHGRAWCLQCGPNSSLRVWAGPELRSSNKFGSHSQFQLSLVTSLAPVWSQLWTVNTPIDAGKEYYQSNVYRIIWVHQAASSLNPALWGALPLRPCPPWRALVEGFVRASSPLG